MNYVIVIHVVVGQCVYVFFPSLQYEALATHYKFVTITIYVVMFLVEAARLYLGYEGNLREKVACVCVCLCVCVCVCVCVCACVHACVCVW